MPPLVQNFFSFTGGLSLINVATLDYTNPRIGGRLHVISYCEA